MKKRGITLLEMIVVMTIIVIITAASIPSFLKFTNTARLRAGARDITTALRSARRYAITKRTAYAVTVYMNNYTVASLQNTMSFYETADSVELKSLPSTIRATSTGYTALEYEFFPGGTIQVMPTMEVRNDDNYIEITVETATGRVKIGEIQ